MAAPLRAVAGPAEEWLLRTSGIGAAVPRIVGAAVLTGWWLDVPRLVRPIPSLPGMVPNSAEWFVLLATSLFVLRQQPVSVTRRGVSAVCALAVVALAAATLAEYIWNLGLDVDQAFFHTALNVGSGFPPGRCAPGSAAAFALLASALLWLDASTAVRIDTPQSSVHTVLHTIALEAQLVADAEYVALGMTGGGDAPSIPGSSSACLPSAQRCLEGLRGRLAFWALSRQKTTSSAWRTSAVIRRSADSRRITRR